MNSLILGGLWSNQNICLEIIQDLQYNGILLNSTFYQYLQKENPNQTILSRSEVTNISTRNLATKDLERWVMSASNCNICQKKEPREYIVRLIEIV